ncbi:MAG: hypothetical protein WBM86_00975, partial [Waterburya sp.]
IRRKVLRHLCQATRVFIVDVPFLDMVKFITKWGKSSPALLEAIGKIQLTKNNSVLPSSEDSQT